MESEGNEETVEVRFVTKLEQFRVTETPFRLPVQLARFGLSGVINHLLSLDPPKPFDFLIGNEFLRSSISQYLKDKNLTKESTIEIEYVEAITAPEPKQEFQHDDWVSCVDASVAGYYVTGSYDNIARIWTNTGDILVTCAGHTKPIQAVKVLPGSTDDNIRLITASQDHTLLLWNSQPTSRTSTLEVSCKGHTNSVTSVDFSKKTASKFCTGSWDTSIQIWNLEHASEMPEDLATSNTKKRKVQSPSQFLRPTLKLSGHTQNVSSVYWSSDDKILSSSWDHTIKIWDIESVTAISTLNGNRVTHCMDYYASMIATSHEDNTIKLWDLRTDVKLVSQTLKSHSGIVKQVKWKNENMLVSVSYDKTVKLWDTRSTIPLHTLVGHQDKVLCVDWDGEKIVSGSADTKLKVWQFK